jgi:hypothetical protein
MYPHQLIEQELEGMTRDELVSLVRQLSISLHAAQNDGSCAASATAPSNSQSIHAEAITSAAAAVAANSTIVGSILGRATEFDANDAMTPQDYDKVYKNLWVASPGALADLAPLTPLSLPNAGKMEQVHRDESVRHAVLEAEKAEDAREEKRTGFVALLSCLFCCSCAPLATASLFRVDTLCRLAKSWSARLKVWKGH